MTWGGAPYPGTEISPEIRMAARRQLSGMVFHTVLNIRQKAAHWETSPAYLWNDRLSAFERCRRRPLL